MNDGPQRVAVRLFGALAGQLEIAGPLRSPEDWRFGYDQAYLARDAIPLSVSLPLRAEPFAGAAARNWFCNLLPEGLVREAIERRLRIPARDDFALLAAIGGECAGAVSIGTDAIDGAEAGAVSQGADLETLLAEQGDDAGEGAWAALAAPRRLSLAGAQDKIAVVRGQDGRLRMPERGKPSSHILKPDSRRLPGLRDLEAFGSALARAIGLDAATAEPIEVAGRRALLVERYDRHLSAEGARIRLHQEDFCQALGMPGELKYQAQGGPSLADCARLIRMKLRLGPRALQAFLDWVVFNALLGNADAHAKNLALLRDPQGGLALAPFYDMVPTIVMPESLVDRTPALDIGGAPRIDAVERTHWESFASDTGYAQGFVLRRVAEMAEAMVEAIPGVAGALCDRSADATRIARAAAAVTVNARAAIP